MGMLAVLAYRCIAAAENPLHKFAFDDEVAMTQAGVRWRRPQLVKQVLYLVYLTDAQNKDQDNIATASPISKNPMIE